MCAINDPIGQNNSYASSDHHSRSLKICFVLRDFEKRGHTDNVQTPRVKIVITTGLVDQEKFSVSPFRFGKR